MNFKENDHCLSHQRSKSVIGETYKKTLNSSLTTLKDMNQFIIGEKLGQGSFGMVRLAIHILSGEKVAIKILDRTKIKEKMDKIRIEREIEVLTKLIHPNIIRIFQVIQTNVSLNIIQEYACGKDFMEYLADKKKIDENEACHYFQQIISALEYIHKQGIAHRDLKPENMILTKTKEIKVIDFGLSNTYKPGELLSTACGSPCYAAPEMLQGKSYIGSLVDIWSAGIILYLMLCGHHPFEDSTHSGLYKKIKNGKFTIPKYVSREARDLLNNILVTNPKKRFKITQIKAHPWFNLIDPKKNLSSGINLKSIIFPIDEDIIHRMESFGYNKQKVRAELYSNELGNSSITYNLFLRQKIKKEIPSVSDLKSEEFSKFLENSNNKMAKYHYNINELIMKRSSSKGELSPSEKQDFDMIAQGTNNATAYNTPRSGSKKKIIKSRMSAKVSPTRTKNIMNIRDSETSTTSYEKDEKFVVFKKNETNPVYKKSKFSSAKTVRSYLVQKIINDQGNTTSTTEETPSFLGDIIKKKPKTIKLIKNGILHHQNKFINVSHTSKNSSTDKNNTTFTIYSSKNISRDRGVKEISGYKSKSVDENGIKELTKTKEYNTKYHQYKTNNLKKLKIGKKALHASFDNNLSTRNESIKKNKINVKKSMGSTKNVPKLNLNDFLNSCNTSMKRNSLKSGKCNSNNNQKYYSTQKNSPVSNVQPNKLIEITSFTKRESSTNKNNISFNYNVDKVRPSSPLNIKRHKNDFNNFRFTPPFDLANIIFKSQKEVKNILGKLLNEIKIKTKKDKVSNIVCYLNLFLVE